MPLKSNFNKVGYRTPIFFNMLSYVYYIYWDYANLKYIFAYYRLAHHIDTWTVSCRKLSKCWWWLLLMGNHIKKKRTFFGQKTSFFVLKNPTKIHKKIRLRKVKNAWDFGGETGTFAMILRTKLLARLIYIYIYIYIFVHNKFLVGIIFWTSWGVAQKFSNHTTM